MAARTREAILADLDTVASELEVVEVKRTELYLVRLRLYQEARALDPPVTQRELAEHAKVSEVAVIQALRKAAKAAAA